ncbi:hypothetical protein [Mucilaginibacter ginsenosidivorax]|uniref:hypothetical protein n=1 Tax=Mucilaginibacter ginsenosidivorax TaxID=862126 RepID=UPI0018644A55|nr:hypothetical protein [Mucilaginibacter ginsenosidivorax]
MAIWIIVALVVILSSIPWSFSPLISRPNFRLFPKKSQPHCRMILTAYVKYTDATTK